MRRRQVHNMDVVPNTSTVGSGIIGAEDFTPILLLQSHLEHVGNKVGLNTVMLAIACRSSSRIEIAKGHEFQIMNLTEPDEHFFEHELRLPVGIDGALRQILRHGHLFRHAIGGTRRTKHKFKHTRFDGRFKQIQATGHVIPKILAWIGHGFAHQRMGGKMNDGLGLAFPQGLRHQGPVAQTALNEGCPRIHRIPMPLRQVVKNGHGVPCIKQFLHTNRTNITRSTCYKYIHKSPNLLISAITSGFSLRIALWNSTNRNGIGPAPP